MIEKIIALEELRPGEKRQWVGDDYDGLVWEDDTDKPTEAEIDARVALNASNEPMRQLRWKRDGSPIWIGLDASTGRASR